MSEIVNVLLLPDSGAGEERILYLKNLLNDPLFNVVMIEPKCPKSNTELEKSYSLLEELWKYKDSNQYVMLLKTSSITLDSTESLVQTIRRSIEVRSDLYYYARYLDKCQLNTIIPERDANRIPELVQTWYPQGLQCIMFSPRGLGIVLGQIPMRNGNKFVLTNPLSQQLTIEVAKGNMTALATNPVVFVYDIMLAENNDDYLKANVCQTIDLTPTQNTSGNLLLFILIVVIVIIAAWAIIVIFRKREPASANTTTTKVNQKAEI